jgi:predicted transcriptional regulator
MPTKPGSRRTAAHENWIAVRIPNETKEWLEQWAERKDTSMSWIVRRLLVEAQQSKRDEKNGL